MLGPRQRRELPRWVPLVALDPRRADRGGGCAVAVLAAADRAAQPDRSAEHVRRHGARGRHERRIGDDPADGDGDTADGDARRRVPRWSRRPRRTGSRTPRWTASAPTGSAAPAPSRCSPCDSRAPSWPRPSGSGSTPPWTPASTSRCSSDARRRAACRPGRPPSVAPRRDPGRTVRSATPSPGPDGLMAIQLMPYLNTISWQSRYETGSTLVLDLAGRPADAVAALPAGVDRRRATSLTDSGPGCRGSGPSGLRCPADEAVPPRAS